MPNERTYDKINYQTNFTAPSTYAILLKAVKDCNIVESEYARVTLFPQARASAGMRYDTSIRDTHGEISLSQFSLIEYVTETSFKLSSLGERFLELFDNDFKAKANNEYNFIATLLDALFAWKDRKYGRNLNVGILILKLLLDERLDCYITAEDWAYVSEFSCIKRIGDYENVVFNIINNRHNDIEFPLKKADVLLGGFANSWRLLEKYNDSGKIKYKLRKITKSLFIEKLNQLDQLYADIGNKIDKVILIDESLRLKGGKNLIIYGVPGCGKSHHLEHEILAQDGISNDEMHLIRTTFFQDYSNTDFVGQIFPKLNDEKVEYEFNPGPFTIALERALKKPDEKFSLVIEEINRGNAASIFGDIFQLLDRDDNGNSKYGIINVNIMDYLSKKGLKSCKTIKIPSNLYIYATMNTSDQNVFTLDNAFKRRWDFERIPNIFTDKHLYKDYFVPGMEKENITWEDLVGEINDYIIHNSDIFINEDKQIGIYFIKDKQLVETNVNVDEAKINQFAYKFFEYLWDDVCKMNHSIIFNDYASLDKLIDSYKDIGSKVFNKKLLDKISAKVDKRMKVNSVNESTE